MSVSDVSGFKSPYQPLLFTPYIIDNIPYIHSTKDTSWNNANDHWELVKHKINQFTETTTAIIIEPIIQGTGGMQLYSQHFLKKCREWSAENDIHFIADEIMTGIGRTGKMFACEHTDINPDFMCLGKGLTSGWLPFSAVLTTDTLYNTFYDDYENENNFLHY